MLYIAKLSSANRTFCTIPIFSDTAHLQVKQAVLDSAVYRSKTVNKPTASDPEAFVHLQATYRAAIMLEASGQPEAAERMLRDMIAVREAAAAQFQHENSTDYVDKSRWLYGRFLMRQGRRAEAESLFRSLLAAREAREAEYRAAYGANSISGEGRQSKISLDISLDLGVLFAETGRWADAEAQLRGVLGQLQPHLKQRSLQEWHRVDQVRKAHSYLARALEELGRLPEALVLLNAASTGPKLNPMHHITAMAVADIAGYQQRRGRHEDAEALCRRVLDAKEASTYTAEDTGESLQSLLRVAAARASALRALGREEEAQQVLQRYPPDPLLAYDPWDAASDELLSDFR